jgi:3-oxoadipate enol-lactonase
MPTCTVNGVELFYTERGEGPAVVFSHGLLWTHAMFEPQLKALADRFRVIAYDHRGQGQSEVPDARCTDMETLSRDAVALIGALDAGPCHFVGLSMGGFVGMRVAARHPELVRSLTLMDTAADPEPRRNVPKYRIMNLVARTLGVNKLLAARVMPILFGHTFLNDPARAVERDALRSELMGRKKSIYKAVNGVIERAPLSPAELRAISAPTLVLWGSEDVAIKRHRAVAMAEAISGAEFVEIPAAGHTATLEQPERVTEALAHFLDQQEARA